MAKFNWWDLKGYFGKHPKRFKREASKQIRDNTLNYLKKFGRHKWVPVEEIFEATLEQTDLFDCNEGKMFFAKSGIKNKINGATHQLRIQNYPIVSGKGHKGYRYADENCDDFIDRWDEKRSAWEKRKTNLSKEKELDIKLMEIIIERLITKKRLKEAEQLKAVLVRYEN